jgi:hypothetical protein
MGMALNRAAFMGRARRLVASFIPFILAVSSLSAISVVTAPSANAATAGSGNCEQTFTASSGSGTVSVAESSGYCYVAFKNTGAVDTQATISWTRPTGLSAADVLVIGGGGGGGARHAGGGGAGGYVEATSYALTTSTVTVVVGAGGSGAAGGSAFRGSAGKTSAFYNPSNSAHGLTALGGGYGSYNEGAGSGGSGGGSGWSQSAGSVTSQGQTTLANSSLTGISFGNVGRSGANEDNAGLDFWAGGGGGGAGARGENPKPSSSGAETTALSSGVASTAIAGAGGIGKAPTWIPTAISTSLGVGQISDSSVYFSGGGGGGMGNDGLAGGAGGLGGGGNGTKAQKTGGIAGTAFTGGGGGSSGFDDISVNTAVDAQNPPGGAGGSGVVVLRYQVRPAAPTITGITGGNNSLSVAFTAATQADVTVTGYKYSTDGGSNWSASTGSTTSPISITGLTNGTSYSVQIRAVSAYWDGVATASTSAVAGAACSVSSITSGGYTTQTITSAGSCVWTTPSGVTRADVLVVGGGGGGSGNWTGSASAAGSGGGGGVYTALGVPVSGVINVVVGAGGAGGTAGTDRTLVSGSQGTTSSFGSLSAGGGGGGGCPTAGTANGSACTDASIKGRSGTAAGNGGSPSNFGMHITMEIQVQQATSR